MADFDIGRQVTLNVISNGAIVSTTQLTEFSAKPRYVNLRSRRLNGPTVEDELPDGWELDLTMDRFGPTWDNYFAQAEDDYWNNNPSATLQINQTFAEKDGSISRYRFDVTTIKFDDAGTYKQDDMIKQKARAFASRRHLVQ